MIRRLRVFISDHMPRPVALLKDRRGNFGVLSALMMIPILGIVGLCMDLTIAFEHREALQQAADSATLDAVSSTNSSKYLARNANIPELNAQTIAQAEGFFRSALRGIGLPEDGIRLNVSTILEKGTLNLKLDYSYDLPTQVLKVVGFPNLTISGSSAGTSTGRRYTNIHIFVDNSPSMGIANSFDAMNDIVRNNREDKQIANCVFACHTNNSSLNTWQVARNHNIPLRIDSVRSSLGKFVDALEARQIGADKYKVALYSFGAFSDDLVARPVTQLLEMTEDMQTVRSSANGIDVIHITNDFVPGARMSDLPAALSALKALIPDGGDGSTAAEADQVLIVVSDGLTNRDRGPKPCSGETIDEEFWRCYEPVDTMKCDAIKQRGIRIATLYTTYLPLVNSWEYDRWIRPFEGEIPVSMRICASEGLAFEVGFNDSMDNVMGGLFNKVTATTPRLTD